MLQGLLILFSLCLFPHCCLSVSLFACTYLSVGFLTHTHSHTCSNTHMGTLTHTFYNNGFNLHWLDFLRLRLISWTDSITYRPPYKTGWEGGRAQRQWGEKKTSIRRGGGQRWDWEDKGHCWRVNVTQMRWNSSRIQEEVKQVCVSRGWGIEFKHIHTLSTTTNSWRQRQTRRELISSLTWGAEWGRGNQRKRD